MSTDPPRHRSPYPNGEDDDPRRDPRPYWHRELAGEVSTVKEQVIQWTLIAQRVTSLEKENKLLRIAVAVGLPTVSGVAAYISRLGGVG